MKNINYTINNNGYRIPLRYHIVFWVIYFLFNFLRWGSYFNDYEYSLKSNIVKFLLHIFIVYFNLNYLIPKFIVSKKYYQYFLYLTLSLAAHYIARTGLNYLLVTEDIWPEAEGVQKAFTFNHIVAVEIGELYVIAFTSAIKLTIDWIYEKRNNDHLKKIQLKTELNFLKTQIQPHFFFNTLNNLYALSLEKSDHAPKVILKLSEIMQYVLYDVRVAKISLLKEINYIHNYLELERLRYGDSIKSKLDISGDIDKVKVPPLLFLPFIENCFKHGAKNNNSFLININFEKKNKELIFNVVNNFNINNNIVGKHGIGIQNVKRRLELLYKENFSLYTNITNNKYVVTLKMPV